MFVQYLPAFGLIFAISLLVTLAVAPAARWL